MSCWRYWVCSVAALVSLAQAQTLLKPFSVPRTLNPGHKFAKSHLLINVDGTYAANMASLNGPAGGSVTCTPDMLKAAYKLPQTGGAGTIAIIDAFHYPTALSDLNTFSAKFNLPQQTGGNPTAAANKVFQVVYANGQQPANDPSWALESALDVQWAHAIAPNAKVVLVEAATSSLADMFKAIQVAKKLPNIRQISCSWGVTEFAGESAFDNQLGGSVEYFASTGDTGGSKNYPAASSYFVAVGGTSLAFNSKGQPISESGWSGSGGGVSPFEVAPSWQQGLHTGGRCYPDIASAADPNFGAMIYTTTPYQNFSGWLMVGGTSWAAPTCAAIANLSPRWFASAALLRRIYGQTYTSFSDITSGTAGTNRAGKGFDLVTGFGSPVGYSAF